VNNIVSVSSLIDDQNVVPVVAIENDQQARGLSRALLDGGVNVIEVTLRNAFGLKAIQLIKEEYSEMVVLAGTVNSAEQMAQVVDAGVDGVISPGITTSLLDVARSHQIPYMPGVATPSEVMLAMEHGLNECKLFPATVVGGIGALKAFKGPFSEIKFCPTGGINDGNYQEFLALDNVMFVGGSWIAPTNLIRAEQWGQITDLCKALV